MWNPFDFAIRLPIDEIEAYWSPQESMQAMGYSPARSSDYGKRFACLEALVGETGADEVMVVSDVYDHSFRLRYFERIAQAVRPVA